MAKRKVYEEKDCPTTSELLDKALGMIDSISEELISIERLLLRAQSLTLSAQQHLHERKKILSAILDFLNQDLIRLQEGRAEASREFNSAMQEQQQSVMQRAHISSSDATTTPHNTTEDNSNEIKEACSEYCAICQELGLVPESSTT